MIKENFFPSLLMITLTLIWATSLLGQFARIDSFIGKISIHEIMMGISLPFLLWNARGIIPSLRSKISRKSPALWFVLFLSYTISITFFRAWEYQSLPYLITAISYLGRLTLYPLFFFFLAQQKLPEKFYSYLSPAILLWLSVQAFWGITQYLFYPDSRVLFYLGWDDHLSRAFGTLLDPGFFGLFMAIGAVITLSKALYRKQWREQKLWILLFSIFLIALTISYSRASFVAYIAGILWMAWGYQQRRILLFIPLLIAALLLVPKDGGGAGQNLLRTQSIAARQEVIEHHTRKISPSEIILGRGWYYEIALQTREQGLQQDTGLQKNFQAAQSHAQTVDNVYLHVLLSSGVIGLGLLGGFFLSLWLAFPNTTIRAILLTVSAHSFFSSAWMYSWILLLLCTGIIYRQRSSDLT